MPSGAGIFSLLRIITKQTVFQPWDDQNRRIIAWWWSDQTPTFVHPFCQLLSVQKHSVCIRVLWCWRHALGVSLGSLRNEIGVHFQSATAQTHLPIGRRYTRTRSVPPSRSWARQMSNNGSPMLLNRQCRAASSRRMLIDVRSFNRDALKYDSWCGKTRPVPIAQWSGSWLRYAVRDRPPKGKGRHVIL